MRKKSEKFFCELNNKKGNLISGFGVCCKGAREKINRGREEGLASDGVMQSQKL